MYMKKENVRDLLWYWREFRISSHFYRRICSWARPRSQTLSETSHGSWGKQTRGFWSPVSVYSNKPFGLYRARGKTFVQNFFVAIWLWPEKSHTAVQTRWTDDSPQLPQCSPRKWRQRLTVTVTPDWDFSTDMDIDWTLYLLYHPHNLDSWIPLIPKGVASVALYDIAICICRGTFRKQQRCT